MTHDEIIRWFRRFTHDPMFRDEKGSHTVPIANLAEWAGLPRQNVYAILNGRVRLSKYYHDRLVAAIEAVQAGMRWKRTNQVWSITDPRFERLPRYDFKRRSLQREVAP